VISPESGGPTYELDADATTERLVQQLLSDQFPAEPP